MGDAWDPPAELIIGWDGWSIGVGFAMGAAICLVEADVRTVGVVAAPVVDGGGGALPLFTGCVATPVTLPFAPAVA